MRTAQSRGARVRTSGNESAGHRIAEAFARHFGSADGIHLVRAPGRVNLIGDHTDYNDGFVLPMTLAQAAYVGIRQRNDRRIRLQSLDFRESQETELDCLPGHGSSWWHYVSGVVEMVRDRGLVTRGFDAVIHGDVPVGSGLSSSASIEVATLLALEQAFGFVLDGIDAAKLCQEVEHRFIGVQCGIMDQFASRMGRNGHALLLDCRTLEFESVPVSMADHVFLITDSRAPRSLAGSKYNQRRSECEQGVEYFHRIDPTVHALRDVPVELVEAHRGELSPVIEKRCLHVVGENERVLRAATALRRSDAESFGKLMTRSHESLRDLYEVSSVHLDKLVDIALETPGVLGARMTGAGFGGCTVTLAHRTAVTELQHRIQHQYKDSFGLDARTYSVEHNIEAGPCPLLSSL